MTQPKDSLQYQIEKKLIGIVGWSLTLMALAVLVIAVVSLYIYRVNKLDHVQNLVQTKISTEISGTLREAAALADTSLLWTALTDSVGREAYLEPLLLKINQSAVHKIELLDYKGRPVLDSRSVDLNNAGLQQLINKTVKTNQAQYFVEKGQNDQSTLYTTMVVNAPFADSPIGFLLISFDLNKLITGMGFAADVFVHLGTPDSPSSPDQKGFWIQHVHSEFIVPAGNHRLALQVTVEQSALYSQLIIVFGFLLMVIAGWLLLQRLKKWSLSFARSTTLRLNSLLDRAREIVAGREVTIVNDGYDDEISNLFQSLQQILSAQQSLNQQLLTFSRIFDHAAEAIMVTDMNGHIIDVNPALLRMTGHRKEDLLGQQSGMLYRDIHNTAMTEGSAQSLIATSIDRYGEWRGETYFKGARGQLIPVMLSASRLRAENGKHLGNVALFSDISQIKDAENQLRELSYNDQLTGLPNYRSFVDHITPLFSHPDQDFSCALIFIDLDNLKMINDKFGHEEGDLAIIKLSEHLRASLPEGTFLCRRSGDEFIALIQNTQNLPYLVRDLRKISHAFTLDAGISEPRLIQTSFSAGAAMYPADAQDLNGILTAADMALRLAKQVGRSQLVWYSKNIQAKAQRLNTVHEKLTHALKRGLIIPHYQPCVDLVTGRIIGFEALARWSDAELGPISPEEFIAIAEQTNLINEITVAILEKVIEDKKSIRSIFKDVTIAVNISPHFFIKREITNFFTNKLGDDEEALNGIVLELTESDLSHNTQTIQLHLQLQTLIGMGLKLAIDDFGKGYSSLSRLGSLPFHKLKIDRSFVRDIEEKANQKIVKSIIALGSSLGLETIAEGVETMSQRDELLKNGCKIAQGFLYARAMPLGDVLKLPHSIEPKEENS